jgi:TfoX/Sxy family transcriptional regulator of competence genes
MAYNEKLADRVRAVLADQNAVDEKKMMGGLTFMVNGKMCIGVLKDDLMIRLDPAVYDVALKRKGCRPMDFTGKPMPGFVFISPGGYKTKKDLNDWAGLALDFNKIAKASKKKNLSSHFQRFR